MDNDIDEKLREVSALGDIGAVKIFLNNGKVNVNSQNKVNGWTALHWASKRNHVDIVKILVEKYNANTKLRNTKNELPIHVTSNETIRKYLTSFEDNDEKILSNCETDEEKLAMVKVSQEQCVPIAKNFTPNYIANPTFPYTNNDTLNKLNVVTEDRVQQKWLEETQTAPQLNNKTENFYELVLKLRNGSSYETDFIEVELPKSELTYQNLVNICCLEFAINANDIRKIRKLPDTILRKDKDIKRLKPFQEIEIILKE